MRQIEKNAMKTVIDLISISVRTAPKSGGIDDIVFYVANDKEKKAIASAMTAIGKKRSRSVKNKTIAKAIMTSWGSDANAIVKSQGLVLIGVRGKKALGLNCGWCGFSKCSDFLEVCQKNKNVNNMGGPYCAFRLLDVGIAVSSAAKSAAMHDVDNRIMYRVGVAVYTIKAMKRKFASSSIKKQVNPILGLPLSASGKNIFFDRLDKIQAGKILKDYFTKRA